MKVMAAVSIRLITSIAALTLVLFIGPPPAPGQGPDTAGHQPGKPPKPCAGVSDHVDIRYGGYIRQIKRPEGHEHNIYYLRNPWNADGSYMVGVRSDLTQRDWRVVLYDGDGCFIKELFPIESYDWRFTWDRKDPGVLYTWKGSELYRFNVESGKGGLLKSFSPLRLKPNGPTLNQAGDRVLVITSDGVFRSYRLPGMLDERTFRAPFPPGCSTDWEDERYIGHLNFIATGCNSGDWSEKATFIYDDRGGLFHRFDGIALGHGDFSPDGRFAYGIMWGARRAGKKDLEVHAVNLDGSDDRRLFGVPQGEANRVQNFHISWPDRVKDWFVVSFFPSASNLPERYAPPLDEIVLFSVSGGQRFLGRTNTAVRSRGEGFWAEPLASPDNDGERISFNSNASGTIDQYILYVPKPMEFR